MNSYFKICKILHEINIPLPLIGDTILVGRWRNSPAIVKSFGKDKNGQPTVKTNRGPYSLFKFRLQKLMKKKEPKKEPV